jgi:hypothetical protein
MNLTSISHKLNNAEAANSLKCNVGRAVHFPDKSGNALKMPYTRLGDVTLP